MGPGRYGDFEWMIENPEYNNSLFIFNDNVLDHKTSRRGAGNAVIRPYNIYGKYSSYPRSAGIPTGHSRWQGGYKCLTDEARDEITDAVKDIEEITEEHDYGRLFFSSQPKMGTEKQMLATSIFKIGEDVREFITDLIYGLEMTAS